MSPYPLSNKRMIGITMSSFAIHSPSPAFTQRIATAFAKLLSAPLTIALEGDLGAGKTTFVTGLIKGLKNSRGIRVQSPTYALARTYETKPTLHHVDLYRLSDEVVLEDLGIESLLDDPDAIVCIEWPKHHANPLPANTIWVHLRSKGPKARELEFVFTPQQAELAAKAKEAFFKLTSQPNLLSLPTNAG
jgi:tRNA threonylcarbamoyl adenosine modification protein YjeE